jgi:hypothetical protein
VARRRRPLTSAGELAAFYADITGGQVTFYVDDLAATQARVLAAGATRYEFQPNADHCLVFADPAGHPFCLTTWDDVPT